MNARLRAWVEDLGDQFWLRPAIVVLLCIGLALLATAFDHTSASNYDATSSSWGYPGGGEGARSLLGAVASSSIGVAGTIFSIIIAAQLFRLTNYLPPKSIAPRRVTRSTSNEITIT